MADYAAIAATLDEVALEAIDWAMNDSQWFRSGSGYRMAGPYAWTVPGPEAGDTGPTTFHEPRSGTDVTFNFWETAYSPIIESVQAIFQPWLDMPKPGEFHTSIAQAIEGTHLLATGEEVNGTPVAPNKKLAAISSASQDLSQMSGNTINAFRWRYLDQMPIVLKGQAGSAATLTEVVTAEAAIWANAQSSIASVAEGMLAAMKARSGQNGAILLTVAGVALAVASSLATGGLSVALGAAGGVAGAAPTFLGDEDRPPLSGGSAMDVIASARAVTEKLDDDIRSEESLLSEKARSMLQQMEGPDYDLTVPPGFYKGDQEEDYTSKGHMIALQGDRLKSVANQHLPHIADQFHASSNALNSADSYSAWSRSSLGLAPCGAYYDWLALREQIIDFLLANEKACHDAADQLLIAAGFVGDTDDQVSQDLDHHADEVRESNKPVVPPHIIRPGMEPI